MPAEPMTAGRVADNPDDALAELLFADAGAALLLLDETSQVRRANPAARAAFGEACQPGALAADLFALADRPAVRGLLAASRDRQPDAMPEAAVCIGGCWLVTAEPWLADGAARRPVAAGDRSAASAAARSGADPGREAPGAEPARRRASPMTSTIC